MLSFKLYLGNNEALSLIGCWWDQFSLDSNSMKMSCHYAGLPTLTVVVCGILGVYGKYIVNVRDDNNSTSQM